MSSDRSSLNTVSGSRFSRVDQFPDLETESPGTPTRQKPPDGTREAPERRTPRQTTSCSEPRSASPTEGAIPGPRPSRRSSREPTRPSWSRIPAGRAVDGQQASNASLFGKGGSRIQGRRRHAAARRLFRVEVDDGPRRGGVTAAGREGRAIGGVLEDGIEEPRIRGGGTGDSASGRGGGSTAPPPRALLEEGWLRAGRWA